MATSELRIKEFLIKSSFTYKYQFDIIHESVLQPHIYQKYNPRRQNETTIQACPISGSSDYGEWLLMCDLYSWSFHCFSCTCWDKERARSSAQPRVLRNDRNSNWLHATLSRETRPRAAAEEQVQWMTKTSGAPSPSWSSPLSASSSFHTSGNQNISLHLDASQGLLKQIPNYNVSWLLFEICHRLSDFLT